MIEFRNVSKIYADGTQALKDVSFTIEKGELMTLIGPSGCGKTTTMKMINRLIDPTKGDIFINKQNIREHNIHHLRWNIGYVLQEIALFPHMTIEENIAIVPEMKKWSSKDIKKRSEELLDMVGLDPHTYLRRMPDELSGGEQQRIGVIRALAADPDIILMDEPFSALDPISRQSIQEDIQQLQKEIKKTICFVTHDMDEALALGDRVCLMRKGAIEQLDKPQELILNPANKFVESFIGEHKSPWQTAIDVVATTEIKQHLLNNDTEEPQNGFYFVTADDSTYSHILHNGDKQKGVTLENNLPLFEAVRKMEEHKQPLYPVLKEDKIVGMLSYADIVYYLEEDMANETGVK